MKKNDKKIVAIFLGVIFLIWTGGIKGAIGLRQLPCRHNEHKWKVGYVLMEESNNYVKTLNNLVEGLENSGWIKSRNERKQPFPIDKSTEKQTKALWKWLNNEEASDYIEFVKSYYPSDEQKKDLKSFSEFIKQDVKDRGIDLIIVMGDTAGEKLTQVNCETKMMVLSTNDAVQSNIVKGVNKSGKDTVWAYTYPNRIENRISVFHELFKFKTLGIVYEDSEEGRIRGNVEAIRKAARAQGIQLIEKHLEDKKEGFFERALAAYTDLADEADAVYLTRYEYRENGMIEKLMQPFYEKHVLIFSALAVNVQWGMFMSVADTEDEGAGEFYADVLARALTEKSLKDIPQVYNIPPKIILNLEAAEKLGCTINFDILLAADEVYAKTAKE